MRSPAYQEGYKVCQDRVSQWSNPYAPNGDTVRAYHDWACGWCDSYEDEMDDAQEAMEDALVEDDGQPSEMDEWLDFDPDC